MALCRFDTDRLRELASRLGALAVALDDATSAVGLLAQHGYADAASLIGWRLVRAVEWLDSWAGSLTERAAVLDREQSLLATRSLTTPDILREARLTAAAAVTLADPASLDVGAMRTDPSMERTLERLARPVASTRAVRDFFASLDPAVAWLVTVDHAELIGNLGGAPLELRFLANRMRLRASLNAAEPGSPRARSLRKLWRRAADLVVFDPVAGRIAEWIGPIDAAHVALVVPGAGVDFDGYAGLAADAHRLVAHDPTAGDLAVVTGLVYATPPTVAHAALGTYADEGAPKLAALIDGLDLGERHVSLIGHSYGSTVLGAVLGAGIARTLPADTDVVFLGSPGVRADHVTDLPLPATRVWAALAPGDPVVLAVNPRALPDMVRCLGGIAPQIQDCDVRESLVHGRNPAHDAFGAAVLDATPANGIFAAHTSYFSVDDAGPSVVLANVLGIATASYGDVRLKGEPHFSSNP